MQEIGHVYTGLELINAWETFVLVVTCPFNTIQFNEDKLSKIRNMLENPYIWRQLTNSFDTQWNEDVMKLLIKDYQSTLKPSAGNSLRMGILGHFGRTEEMLNMAE